MGHVHYRVRRLRHGSSYRGTGARGRPASAPPPPPTGRPARMRKEGLGVVSRDTTSAWRALLAPDGTPPALPLQVAYVRRAVWRETGMTPSLRGLTIGQAERVLGAVGADPAPLWRVGRNAAAANCAAAATKWLVIVLLCLEFLAVGRIAGIPFILVAVGIATVAFTRRQRQQAFEDRHYRTPGPSRRADRPGAEGHGAAASAPEGPATPPPASPYDLDEYLRRLNDEGA